MSSKMFYICCYQINEMGGSYIWKPINCSGNNHVYK